MDHLRFPFCLNKNSYIYIKGNVLKAFTPLVSLISIFADFRNLRKSALIPHKTVLSLSGLTINLTIKY